jgi:hypothetical protein
MIVYRLAIGQMTMEKGRRNIENVEIETRSVIIGTTESSALEAIVMLKAAVTAIGTETATVIETMVRIRSVIDNALAHEVAVPNDDAAHSIEIAHVPPCADRETIENY